MDAGAAEYRERDRLWRQKKRESDPSVREKERDYSQAYYQTHKESVLEKKSEYQKKRRAEHPEEVRANDREQRKRYVAMHQEEVIAKKQIKHLCECGGKYFRPRHIAGCVIANKMKIVVHNCLAFLSP